MKPSKVKVKKAAPTIVVSATEKTTAAELFLTGVMLGELQADYFGMIREAVVAGCTFEGLEQAEPGLKDIGAYRSAKSVIVNAKKQGKSLVNGDGSAKTKNAIAAELAPSGLKGQRKGKARGGKAKVKATPSKIDTITAAFAILKSEPAMRRAFSDEIQMTARALANDNAERAPRVRVSKQRTSLAGAAAKQAQAA